MAWQGFIDARRDPRQQVDQTLCTTPHLQAIEHWVEHVGEGAVVREPWKAVVLAMVGGRLDKPSALQGADDDVEFGRRGVCPAVNRIHRHAHADERHDLLPQAYGHEQHCEGAEVDGDGRPNARKERDPRDVPRTVMVQNVLSYGFPEQRRLHRPIAVLSPMEDAGKKVDEQPQEHKLHNDPRHPNRPCNLPKHRS